MNYRNSAGRKLKFRPRQMAKRAGTFNSIHFAKTHPSRNAFGVDDKMRNMENFERQIISVLGIGSLLSGGSCRNEDFNRIALNSQRAKDEVFEAIDPDRRRRHEEKAKESGE